MSCAKTSLPEYIHPSRGTPRESFLRAVSCVQVDDTPEISKKSCTPATYTSQNHKRWDTTGSESLYELRHPRRPDLAIHHPYRPFQIRPQDRAVEWRDPCHVGPPQPVMAMHRCHHDEL